MAEQGAEAIVSKHWEHGSKGVLDLATRVAEIADSDMANFASIYPDEMPLPVGRCKLHGGASTGPRTKRAGATHRG